MRPMDSIDKSACGTVAGIRQVDEQVLNVRLCSFEDADENHFAM